MQPGAGLKGGGARKIFIKKGSVRIPCYCWETACRVVAKRSRFGGCTKVARLRLWLRRGSLRLALRLGDIVSIERVASSKVVIRALDDEQLFYYEGKRYKVAKDKKEPNTIELALV